MAHYREDHERILTLIVQRRWLAFTSEDEGLLKAFVFSGFLTASAVPGHPGKTRLSLTDRGSLYLAELRASHRLVRTLVIARPTTAPRRRASDGELETAKTRLD